MLYETCIYENVNYSKNVMAAVVFIGHALAGYGRGHTWIGSGCPREVGYLCFPQGPVLSQAHRMTDGTSSKHAYVTSVTGSPVCFALVL